MYSQYTLRSLIIHAHAYIYIFTYSSHILCTLAQRVNSLSSVESALVIPHKYFARYFSKKKKEKGNGAFLPVSFLPAVDINHSFFRDTSMSSFQKNNVPMVLAL